MEESEVFDSSMLKETINSLIASGKRNFAIDMSPLDYIYSDTINMLMALNKRVLDVTGRLSLMAPQPEVMQILKRAGIHNVLRVFETETELIKSSEDMILQTSSINMSDVDAARKQGPPQSEFDQLRNEIGSVFGDSASAAPAAAQESTGNADEFDQMFQQFGKKQQGAARDAGQPRPPSAPPPLQQPAPPQQPSFQPRQFTQPPAQPMPMRPAAPPQPRQPADGPKFTPEYPTVRSETQRFTTAPGAPSQEQRFQPPPPPQEKPYSFQEEEETFEAPVKQKPVRQKPVPPSFDDDDFHDDEFQKKSSLPILVIVLLIIALGGAGAYVIYMTLGKKKVTPPVASVTPSQPQQPAAPPTPQIPVETPDSLAKDTAAGEQEAADAVVPEKEIVKSKPEVRRPPVRKTVSKPAPRRRTTTAPKRRTPPAATNQVVISSSPSGASLSINGKKVGTTPYTWNKPIFGKVTIKLSKSGYENIEKSFEYTGGKSSQSVTLTKATVRTPPPPPPPAPKKQPPPPVVKTQPKKAPPPPVEEDDIDDPFADIGDEDDDFALEPEEPIKPATPAPAAKPPAAASSGGGQALIFIASIPPVADVYLNGTLIGKTNVSELKIPAGVQTLKFVKGGKEITKQLNLQPGKNPSQMVRLP
jgi:anti-anti-sigma factor